MSVGGRQILIGLGVIAAIFLVVEFAVESHQLDAFGAGMVKAGKAAGLIDPRFPTNCARIVRSNVDRSWGTIDEPLWNRPGDRCAPYSRKLMIVFHRVRGRFRVVTTRAGIGRYGGCTVPGVPHSVSRSMALC